MEVGADVCSYRMSPEDIGYCELASAVIRTAVEDYRVWRKMQLNDCKNRRAQSLVDEVRTFFMSEFFEAISAIENPNEFLEKLDEQIVAEYERERSEGIRQKRRYSKTTSR